MDEALKAKLEAETPVIKVEAQPLVEETPVATQTTTTVTESAFKLPDLTPAQITADVVFIVGLAAAFGLKIDGDTSTSLTAAAIAAFTLVNAVHKLADAYLRGKRADNADKLKT